MQPLQNIVTLTAFHTSSNEKAIPLTVFLILCIEASASFSLSQVAVWVEGEINFADNTFTVNDIRYPWRIHV